jgi:ABC-type multidrug transport system fused ATPase/permease subunit
MAASLVCGLVVALFWGLNFSAVYPLLTVLLENKTLVQWVDDGIDQERTKIVELEKTVAGIQTDRQAGDERAVESGELARRESELNTSRSALGWYQWSRPFLEKYTPDDSFKTLCVLMAGLMVAMFLKGIFDFLQEYLAGSVVSLAVFDLRRRLYRKTLGLDLSYFTEKGTHDLTARLTNDVESLAGGMRALLTKVMLEPLKAASCLTFACFLNWRLTLLALTLFPLAAAAMGVIGRYLKKVSRRNLESMTRIFKILQESFQGIRVVKAFTMESYERRRFFAETKRYFHQELKLLRVEAIGGPFLELMGVATVVCALLAGSYLVMTQKTHVWGIRLTFNPIDKPMLLTLYGLLLGMSDPLRKVFSVYGRVQRGVAAADRVFAAMDQDSRLVIQPRAPQMARHSRSIEFRNVSFGYIDGRPVLQNVDLKVRFGETIAIVGATGCGKTSMINLLPRFYDTTGGQVLIDGVDIRSVALRSLREQMGIVTQHTVLFADTAFNNITYGNKQAERERVEAAAKAAYAHKFIEDLPQGYETDIGELGSTLSGGQRQRIALARAILRDPAILILDEATSSLDVESEALIHKALQTFTRGRTTFVVTHRLSTLDIADRIVVVDQGRVEAIGTHEELLMRSTTYRRLHDVQAKGA